MGQNKALLIRVGAFAVVAMVAIYFGYRIIEEGKELPVYSPSELSPELVDSSKRDIDSGHRIEEFRLIDQHGDTITRADMEGRITVVNFFFTSCQGICPNMNGNLEKVVSTYEGNEKVQFFSHSVDPSYDSVEVLKDYAKRFDHTDDKWHFLTGEKEAIYRLARGSYFAVKPRSEAEDAESDFIHTENVVLVDEKGRLRGFYDGTSQESMDELVSDIEVLLR